MNATAAWRGTNDRALAIRALGDLVNQTMDQRQDDLIAQCILQRNPELRENETEKRDLSETLAVPLWYLLSLDSETLCDCCDAAELIHTLRDQARADEMRTLMEQLRPVTEDTLQ